MKMAGLITVFSTWMVLAAGWADAAGALQVSNEKAVIYGKVVDAITGMPLANVSITLDGNPDVGPFKAQTYRTTSADGSYRFEDLQPTVESGFYYLTVCSETYHCSYNSEVRAARGDETRVDFAMERYTTLTVRIVSGDETAQAIASVRIAVFQGELAVSNTFWKTHLIESDSMGESPFSLSRHDPYTLTVAKPGFKSRSLTRTLTRKAWAETLTVALEPEQLDLTRGLAGAVADLSGSAEGVEVLFLGEQADGTRFLFYDTVQAGRFRMDGIPMDVVGGWLRVPHETMVVGSDGFAKDYRLNSRRPIPTMGVRAAAREGRGKWTRSVSRWGTWEGKGRSFDIQGREQSFRLKPSAMPRLSPSK